MTDTEPTGIPEPYRSRLTPEQAELAVASLPFAIKQARIYARRCPRHTQEMVGVAVLAMCDAATRWDSTRRVNFRTWVSYRIQGALLDFARKSAAEWDRYVIGYRPQPFWCNDHQLLEIETRDFAEHHIGLLPRRMQHLVRRVLVDEVTIREAAAEIRLSTSRACTQLREAIERMKASIEDERLDHKFRASHPRGAVA